METIDIPIADVVVGDRIRKDVGDTTDLMASMDQVGQLHPIGVDGDNRLIFGGRRLDAAERAGWTTIRAIRLPNLDTAAKLLRAEQDENTCRQPLTPLEMRELARRLDALTPRAKPGPKATPDESEELCGKFPRNSEPASKPRKRREKVIAEAVGVDPKTLNKINVVAAAAEKPDAPPEVKAAAKEMDRTGKVEPAYQVVKAATAPLDDGEQLRASLLRRLDIEADIQRLCESPAGRNVKRAAAVEALGKLVAAIKGERPALDPVAEIALPPPLDGDDFRAKWREWCSYRRSKRKPVTKAAAEKQIKKLQAAGLLAALAAIDDAIANDYQGVFPERVKANGGNQRQRIGAGQQYDEAHEGSGRL